MIFNSDLLRDLAEEKVVLFLGAGVSASSVIGGKPAFKGWPEFLKHAAESRQTHLKNQVIALIDSKDFLLACQLLKDDYEETQWQEAITAEYGKSAAPSALHKAIISLRQRIILTTNFDKLIENAWAQHLPPGSRSFKTISKIDEHVFKSLKDYETPYLIKIHGSVDNTESLVFSRSEYIRQAFGNKRYSSFLDALLLNYTILFIGFSMDDPAISSLMEMYALNYPGARPHYILAPKGGPENISDINKNLRKLSIIAYDSTGNHKKLPKLIDEMAKAANLKRREIYSEKISFLRP